MDTRTAPRWIRDREKGYARRRLAWMGVTAVLAVSWLGMAVSDFLPRSEWWFAVGVCSIAAFAILKPGERARHYGLAANALNAAAVRYEVSYDPLESTLADADRRARETARIERIRAAPAAIREKRRGYRMANAGWYSPAVVLWVLSTAEALLRWPWSRPWPAAAIVAVLLAVAVVTALVKARGTIQAARILTHAIDRYEYEAAAMEDSLAEADGLAAEALKRR